MVPKTCFIRSYKKDISKDKYLERIACEFRDDDPSGYTSIFQSRLLVDQMKDPETLDDSDMDELMSDLDPLNDNISFDSGNEAKYLEEAGLTEQEEDELHRKKHPRIKKPTTFSTDLSQDLKPEQEYMLIGDNTIQVAGDSKCISNHIRITDCKPIRNSYHEGTTIILTVHSDGTLYSILPIGRQFWNLRQRGEWMIIPHPNGDQFVLVEKKKGVCKFFKFSSMCKFYMVNNLYLDDTTILGASFFPNPSTTNFLLFLPCIRYERVVYFCIEWDSNSEYSKEVHQVTYLNGNPNINGCLPVGFNQCLVYSNSGVAQVSANQIMSGEVTFQNFNIRALRGIKSFFPAPSLLDKLKKMNEKSIDGAFLGIDNSLLSSATCTVLSMSTGNICICLMNDQENIQFYSLTRFKGVKAVGPAIDQPNDVSLYDLIVISFGRTLKLTLDLTDIKELTKTSNIAPLSSISNKTTLASSSEENTNIMTFTPSKNYGDDPSEVWLTSPATISKISNPLPAIKTSIICKSTQFQRYTRIHIIDCSNLMENLKLNLFSYYEDEEEQQEKNKENANRYLIVSTDFLSVSKPYIVNVNKTGESDLIEVEDFLFTENEETLKLFFTPESIVQVTTSSIFIVPQVSLLNHTVDVDKVQFTPRWQIHGACRFGDIVVIWNAEERAIQIIYNINDLLKKDEKSSFKEIKELTQKLGDDYTNINNVVLNEIPNTMDPSDSILRLFVYTQKSILEITPISATLPHHVNVTSEFIPELKDAVLINDTVYAIREGNLMSNVRVNAAFELERYRLLHNPKKDIQLRKYGKDKCISFTHDEVHMIQLKKDCYENERFDIKITHDGRCAPIIDLQVDAENGRLFILTSNGLQILNLKYQTWNYSNYLLKSTRSVNKVFRFIDKINRMIVVNLDAKEWDCIKLSNGKILSLGSDILVDKLNAKLVNMVEIPHEGTNVHLLLNYENVLKLVELVPQKGGILTELVCSYTFNSNIKEKVFVDKDGSFFVLQIGDKNGDVDTLDKLIKLRMRDNVIEKINELKFNGKGEVCDFEVCNDDIIMITNKRDSLFMLKQFSDQHKGAEPKFYRLSVPKECRINKIKTLDENCFSVAVQCDYRSDYVGAILLYNRNGIEFTDRDGAAATSHMEHDDNNESIFDNVDYYTGELFDEDINFQRAYEEYQYKPHEEVTNKKIREGAIIPTTRMQLKIVVPGHPYQSIRTDKIIRDIAYNGTTSKLYCLLNDQTVITLVPPEYSKYQYRVNPDGLNEDESESDNEVEMTPQNNYGYDIRPKSIPRWGENPSGFINTSFQDYEDIHTV